MKNQYQKRIKIIKTMIKICRRQIDQAKDFKTLELWRGRLKDTENKLKEIRAEDRKLERLSLLAQIMEA